MYIVQGLVTYVDYLSCMTGRLMITGGLRHRFGYLLLDRGFSRESTPQLLFPERRREQDRRVTNPERSWRCYSGPLYMVRSLEAFSRSEDLRLRGAVLSSRKPRPRISP